MSLKFVFVLLAILLALCNSRRVPEKIISITGMLDTLTAQKMAARPQNVESVVQGAYQSRIHFSGSSEELEELLSSAGYVEYTIEDNVAIDMQSVLSGAVWNLDILDNDQAHQDGRYLPPGTGEGINIYLLDLGVNTAFEDLENRAFRDPAWKDEPPCNNNHGTWTAVIAAGKTYGVAEKAILWDVKLPHGSSCVFYVSDALEAFDYLLTQTPPFVVSMSWKANLSPSINNACQGLREYGAILVAAAGNDGTNNGACAISPASSSATISVASVGEGLIRSSWSNYGDCIDIFAPGEDITGGNSASNTVPTVGSGTSASTPQVAGAIAVIMQAYHLSDPDEVTQKLLDIALDGLVSQGGTAPNKLLNFEGPVSSPPSPSPPTPSSDSPSPAPSPVDSGDGGGGGVGGGDVRLTAWSVLTLLALL